MAETQLAYGRQRLAFSYDANRFEVLAPNIDETARDHTPLSDLELGVALDQPLDSPPLEEIISPQESILIVVSDATRATASAQVVNLLVRRLIELSVAPGDIRIIFATGIHRRVTAQEKNELLSSFITQRIRTIDHDPDDAGNLINLGETKNGTPVEVNRALEEHSHVILTGGINFHYFAGFTGGRKSICPGLASSRTIAATHALALGHERGGRRQGVGTGRLDGNPVHEECERIAAQIAPSFLVNTVVDAKGRATRVYAGDWRAAHRLGCAEYATDHVLPITEKRPLVIASCGGWPKDINLIQAHKALEMAAHACTDGGTIVLLAECEDGLGRPDFMKWFDAAGGSRALEQRLREQYEVNGQTAWSLLTKTERYRVLLVSQLPAEDVRRMNITPVTSLYEAMKEINASENGYIIPDAATYLPAVQP